MRSYEIPTFGGAPARGGGRGRGGFVRIQSSNALPDTSNMNAFADVSYDTPQEGDELVYNAAQGAWIIG